MLDSTQQFRNSSPPARSPHRGKQWIEHVIPATCGLLGACTALLMATVPALLAWLAAGLVITLSALENETFLLLVIFFMPVGWMLAGDTPVRNVHVVFHGLVVAGFFLGRSLRRSVGLADLMRPAVSRACLLFLAAAIVPLLVEAHKRRHESIRSMLDLVVYIGFYFLLIAWVNSRDRMRKIQLAVLISTILTTLFGFYQELNGGFGALWTALYPPDFFYSRWEWRAASFLSSANNFAGYLNVIIPFSLGCYVLGLGTWRYLGKWTFVLGVVALFTTQSIGGLCGLAAVLTLATARFVRTTTAKLAILGSLALSACTFYAFIHVLAPVHTSEQLGSDAVTRFAMWASAWNLFTHSPVFGVGWGNFTAVFDLGNPYFVPDQVAAHNIYLQLLSETGLVGFAAFFYLVFQSWTQAHNLWRGSRDSLDCALAFGVQGAFVATLVHGFVDFLFQADPQYGTLFFTMLGLLVASSRHSGVLTQKAKTARPVAMCEAEAL